MKEGCALHTIPDATGDARSFVLLPDLNETLRPVGSTRWLVVRLASLVVREPRLTPRHVLSFTAIPRMTHGRPMSLDDTRHDTRPSHLDDGEERAEGEQRARHLRIRAYDDEVVEGKGP